MWLIGCSRPPHQLAGQKSKPRYEPAVESPDGVYQLAGHISQPRYEPACEAPDSVHELCTVTVHAPDAVCCVQYDSRLRSYMEDYDKLFVVHADNVGSKQFQEIRRVRCPIKHHTNWLAQLQGHFKPGSASCHMQFQDVRTALLDTRQAGWHNCKGSLAWNQLGLTFPLCSPAGHRASWLTQLARHCWTELAFL